MPRNFAIVSARVGVIGGLPRSFSARLGGDEFMVLVEYAPTAEVGIAIAERILAAMREPVDVEGTRLEVGISIGIGLHFPARSREDLLALADAALYEAKQSGRNTWRIRSG
jgi:diguanylate cyclase (GGDEF)-like protein